MIENNESKISRRDFLKDTGKVTAASALAFAGSIPAVHAQGSSLINVAFVGCGGRGTGAAAQALTADGPTSRRMIKLAADASAKNLKCGVGLMSRHARPLQELHERIQNGELGDIILMRGYRMQGAIGHCQSVPKPANIGHVEYQ